MPVRLMAQPRGQRSTRLPKRETEGLELITVISFSVFQWLHREGPGIMASICEGAFFKGSSPRESTNCHLRLRTPALNCASTTDMSLSSPLGAQLGENLFYLQSQAKPSRRLQRREAASLQQHLILKSPRQGMGGSDARKKTQMEKEHSTGHREGRLCSWM